MLPGNRPDGLEDPGDEVHHLSAIENPEYERQVIRIEGVVSSTSIAYLVPKEVDAKWLSRSKELKQKDFFLDSASPDNIKFCNVSEGAKHKLLAGIMGVPWRANIDVLTHRLVYRVRLRPRVYTLEKRGERVVDEEGRDYKPFNVYIVSDTGLNLQPATSVVLEGVILPDPKTQRATFMATGIEFPEAVDSFDRAALRRLRVRWQGMTVRERVDWILENFEAYSGVVGRRNLACAALLSFFTPVWIRFQGDVRRGWGIVLLIGDTTTGKSETVLKLIMLLRKGTLITAETATAVGLTAAAVKMERGEWFVDFGFLVLMDMRLLAIDGFQRLGTAEQAATAEAERRGVVVKSAAAKAEAPARTRQVKIANAVDLQAGRYGTRKIGSFLHPVQAVASIMDKTGIARLDLAVVSDEDTVRAEEVNRPRTRIHDPYLELLREVLKLVWSCPRVEFTEEAEARILSEATRLYNKFRRCPSSAST